LNQEEKRRERGRERGREERRIEERGGEKIMKIDEATKTKQMRGRKEGIN
jgi:hypothetical protein